MKCHRKFALKSDNGAFDGNCIGNYCPLWNEEEKKCLEVLKAESIITFNNKQNLLLEFALKDRYDFEIEKQEKEKERQEELEAIKDIEDESKEVDVEAENTKNE